MLKVFIHMMLHQYLIIMMYALERDIIVLN